MTSLTESEQRFERYLTDYGYDFEHEPDLGIGNRPDYMVKRNDHAMVCEVKQFSTTVVMDAIEAGGGGYTTLSSNQVFGTVREQIRAAARQMRDLNDRGMPLVIVLSNPTRADVSLVPQDVLVAMYGDLAYTQLIGPEGAVGEGTTILDRNGVLTNDRQYVSAVVTLSEVEHAQDWADGHVVRFDDPIDFLMWANQQKERPHGSHRYVHVFHTIGSTRGLAVPLPDDVFSGPDDKHYRYDGQSYRGPAF